MSSSSQEELSKVESYAGDQHSEENVISRINTGMSHLTHMGQPDPLVENNPGVEKIISRIQSRAGALGPLESEIDDLQKIETNPDPNSTFNELDEWKYPVDKESGLRIVEFVEGDKGDPRNWSKLYKWYLTILLGTLCFDVALLSAMVTGDIQGPMETFHVSQEVVILTVTLLVLGFGFGPLLFSPLSEEVGRNFIYRTTFFCGVVFVIPCALAKNIGTLLVFRLLDGLALSAPMTLIGGSLADMWINKERGTLMLFFSAAPFLGPCLGPLIGGFIGDYFPLHETWRWIYWIILIFSGAVYVLMLLTLPETHHGILLKRRAQKLRKITGDETYKSINELKVRDFKEVMKETLARPFILLSELIVFLVTLYMSVIYGLLYMFFFAYPVVYGEGKGWSDSKVGLMFIPIAVGVVIGTAVAPFINADYNRRAQKYFDRGELPPLELRLIPMMALCWLVPIGLFSFLWSSYPHVHWAGPCISGLACGVGFLLLYNPANNYIVDSYQHYAASLLASKTFVRSVWGACVVLFTVQMYHRLGYEWASSLMLFISLACCAIPYLFYIYGARIRARSKYAYSPETQKLSTESETSG